MSSAFSDEMLEEALVPLALKAGAAVMAFYENGCKTAIKDDASPVTEADHASEAIILAGLAGFAPETPVLAEERAAAGEIPDPLGERFFLVDPLDGTKEFVNRTGEFTINIALIEDGAPVYGVIFAPGLGRLYAGGRAGAWAADVGAAGAFGARRTIRTRPAPNGGLIAIASRSHRSKETDEFLRTLDIADFTAAGSSLKFCLVAEGQADIYPRFGRTMEWDTGAGQAILEAAGGAVRAHPDGGRLGYGKKARGFDNPHFIAQGADQR